MPKSSNDNNKNRIDLAYASQIKDGDELHNINSYEYLKNIASAIPEQSQIPVLISLRRYFQKNPDYKPRTAYGNHYSRFLLKMENDIEKIRIEKSQWIRDLQLAQARLVLLMSLPDDQRKTPDILFFMSGYQNTINELSARIKNIDQVINLIYANPNQALERAAKMMHDVVRSTHQTSEKIEEKIRSRMQGKEKGAFDKFANKLNYVLAHRDQNKSTPQQEGSYLGRLTTMLSSNFKPQMSTSLASIRQYDYKNALMHPVEYRFGTQGQYHKGKARISPLFEEWLQVQAGQYAGTEKKITHIYFNNLARDRSDYEGKREKKLTHELEGLEGRHSNVAVITLPADKGLMHVNLTRKHARSQSYKDAFDAIRDIATGESLENIQDFYISPAVKGLLYREQPEQDVINKLLASSFEKLGFSPDSVLSDAEVQAVYFHFIKYELTRFIIDTLQPVSFNMSCKDAIDRGGVSSLYYNLLRSIESGQPMSREEFERGLHAAPTLVKGRGMNHHTILIWNALNNYMKGLEKTNSPIPSWLSEWHTENIPKYSREYFLNKLEEYVAERAKGPAKYSIFGQFVSHDKVAAVNKLLSIIRDPNVSADFTEKEWGALNDGSLKQICREAEKHGVFRLHDCKPSQSIHMPKHD